MTVEYAPGHVSYGQTRDDYRCVWFKGASKESGDFAEHLLQAYTPPQK
jgi:uncharacterized protein YodC (DUF2158 family)